MTNFHSIFEISRNELNRLNAEEAVYLFRDLLWAEARKQGISIGKINIPTIINVADGGIDASVDEDVIDFQEGLIKKGKTAYQIKAVEEYKPWQESTIIYEIFNKKGLKESELYAFIQGENTTSTQRLELLGESIKNCLDSDGTYILVAFKQEFQENQLINVRQNLVKYFKLCGYENPKVEVFGQSQLEGFINQFPPLVLRFKEQDYSDFRSHEYISNDRLLRKNFIIEDKNVEEIKKIREILFDFKQDMSSHIRIIGEAGVGKTKLALEATNSPELKPLVLYIEYKNGLLNVLEKNKNIILIVDECNHRNAAKLWNELQYNAPNIKLITIFNEPEAHNRIQETYYPEITPLTTENITKIIMEEYKQPLDIAKKWAEYCEGSPRVAHVVGESLRTSPDNIFGSEDVWERFISNTEQLGSEIAKQRKTVLTRLALFKRFGYDKDFKNEIDFIFNLIHRADTNISFDKFKEIIKELKERKVLQGEYSLYISPKLFHIWLWCEYWHYYGDLFDFDKFTEGMPEQLLEWFFDMLRYASNSAPAQNIVEQLLGEGGPFEKFDFLNTEKGSNFFLRLTEAYPKSALKCLKRVFETRSNEDLKKFEAGRWGIVFSLERILYHKNLSIDAAKILFKLARNETHPSYGNNSTGLFKQLFHRQLSGTGASLEERVKLLKDLFNTENDDKSRELLLDAADAALETGPVSKTGGAEIQGFNTLEEYQPKTYGEIWDYYKNVWELLLNKIKTFDKPFQAKASKILLNNAYSLMKIKDLKEYIVDSLYEVEKKNYIEREEFLKKIIEMLNRAKLQKMPEDFIQPLEDFKKLLYGNDFISRLKAILSVEDYIQQGYEEPFEEAQRKFTLKISELAKEFLTETDKVESNLRLIISSQFNNAYKFAYEVGKIDKNNEILNQVIELYESIENPSAAFVYGYLRTYFEKDKDNCESFLEVLSQREKFIPLMPEITWRSCQSDKSAEITLKLAKEDKIKINSLWGLAYASNNISSNLLEDIVKFLIQKNSAESLCIALEITNLGKKHVLPKDLIFSLLMLSIKPETIDLDKNRHNIHHEYNWKCIANKYIEDYFSKDECLKLADSIIKNLGNEDAIFIEEDHSAFKVLNKITTLYPEEVWDILSTDLEDTSSLRFHFELKNWLSSFMREERGEPAIVLFPVEKIFQWIDQDREKRAGIVAQFVPRDLSENSLVRKILARYGDIQEVQDEIYMRFETGMFSGLESENGQKIKEELQDQFKNEDNEYVIKWVETYIDRLDKKIEQARKKEERRYW